MDFPTIFRRSLARAFQSPLAGAAIVLSLAVGVGVNSAVFTVVRAVLLSPLAHLEESDRMLVLWRTNPYSGAETLQFSPADFHDFKEGARSLQGMAAIREGRVALTGIDTPREVRAAWVTEDFFDVSRVVFHRGGPFPPSGSPTVVLSYGEWRRLGGGEQILGSTLEVNGKPRTIVGVLPPEMSFPSRRTTLWLPLQTTAQFKGQRVGGFLLVVGRLRDGVGIEQARSELEGVSRRLAETYPEDEELGVRALPLLEQLTGPYRDTIWTLQAIVAAVLLLSLSNIVHLQTARLSKRARPLAIERALGASAPSLWLSSFLEASWLGLIGGGLSVAVAAAILTAKAYLPPDFPRAWEISLDGASLAVTLSACLAVVLLATALPLRSLSERSIHEVLGSRPPEPRIGRIKLSGALLVSEAALAVVLLIAASLMVRSFQAIQQIDLGFDSENLLGAGIWLPESRYETSEAQRLFWRNLVEQVTAHPEVESAAAASSLPVIGGAPFQQVAIGEERLTGQTRTTAAVIRADPGFFKTLGCRIVEGRAFEESDAPGAPAAFVVNRRFVREHLSGGPAIGRRLQLLRAEGRIVGVVEDVRNSGFFAESVPEVYVSTRQDQRSPLYFLAVRRMDDGEAAERAVYSAVKRIDPHLPTQSVGAMERFLSRELAPRRLASRLLNLFSLASLALALAGVFGYAGDLAQRKQRELAVRSALGAPPRRLVWHLMRQTLLQAMLGVGVGILLSDFAMPRLSHLLYQAAPRDYWLFLTVSLALLAAAAVACGVPARRAARLNPWPILNSE